jgi:hypothetical protein
MFIPNPDLDFLPTRIPYPGSRGQKDTGRDPGSGFAILLSFSILTSTLPSSIMRQTISYICKYSGHVTCDFSDLYLERKVMSEFVIEAD